MTRSAAPRLLLATTLFVVGASPLLMGFGPFFKPVRTQSLALGVDGAWSPAPGSEEGSDWLVGTRAVYAVQESYILIPKWWWGLSFAGHRHLGADRWRISGAGMVGFMPLGLEVGGYADLRDGESHRGAFVGLGLTSGLATLYARRAVYASDGAPFTDFGVRLQAPYFWKKKGPSWLGKAVGGVHRVWRGLLEIADTRAMLAYARDVDLVSWEVLAPKEPTRRRQPRVVDPTVFHVPVEPELDPIRGPLDAPVTIVVFAEPTRGPNLNLWDVLDRLSQIYGSELRVVVRRGWGSRDYKSVQATFCAQDQGRFWDLHARLLAYPDTRIRDLGCHGLALGLDMDAFRECMADETAPPRFLVDQMLHRSVGKAWTTMSFVNGRKVGGAPQLDVYRALVDEELVKGRVLLEGSASPEGLYEGIIAGGVRTEPSAAVKAKLEALRPRQWTMDIKAKLACDHSFPEPLAAPRVQTRDVRLPRVRVRLRVPPLPRARIGKKVKIEVYLQGRPAGDPALDLAVQRLQAASPRLSASEIVTLKPGEELQDVELMLRFGKRIALEALPLEWSLVVAWRRGAKMWTTHKPLCRQVRLVGGRIRAPLLRKHPELCVDLPQPSGDLETLRDVLLPREP